jgi:outer membrane receptor protein involved in Fe transport
MDTLGINTRANWSRFVHHGMLWTLGYQFSRFSNRLQSFFANRTNISGNAGIHGNDQSPLQWGPPTLQFASGIATLTDGIPASDHIETNTESSSLIWTHHTHSITLGGDYRREQLNFLSQENPRGTLSFTGAATGSDFTDFLAGIPDTSSIAFGNADKYLRESGYDGYIADDWRVNASLTANIGLRYEYAAPITELRNRLANLDVTGSFSEAAPVLAGNPIGPLSGNHLSNALMHPDRAGWQPRVGIAWRPPSGSSLIVRAGYGIYRNTSVYESVATQLDQQPPFSKSFNIQNSPTNPLTLANAFDGATLNVPNTFGIDPNFRVGYAHNWQLSVQRDLPGSLVLLATYSGIKGDRGTQEFLPNTIPPGRRHKLRALHHRLHLSHV